MLAVLSWGWDGFGRRASRPCERAVRPRAASRSLSVGEPSARFRGVFSQALAEWCVLGGPGAWSMIALDSGYTGSEVRP